MLQCPNCQETQEVGKFCGECGTKVVEMEQVEQVQTPVEEQPSMDYQGEAPNQEMSENVSIHMEEAATKEPAVATSGNSGNMAGGQIRESQGTKTDIKEEALQFWNTAL